MATATSPLHIASPVWPMEMQGENQLNRNCLQSMQQEYVNPSDLIMDRHDVAQQGLPSLDEPTYPQHRNHLLANDTLATSPRPSLDSHLSHLTLDTMSHMPIAYEDLKTHNNTLPNIMDQRPEITASPMLPRLTNLTIPTTPIFTIDACEEQIHPLQIEAESLDHASSLSRPYLSPYDADDQYDESDYISIADTASPTAPAFGYFNIPLPNHSQTSDADDDDGGAPRSHGVGPNQRRHINAREIPSINEAAQARLLNAKNSDVEDWLSASDIGSDVEGARFPRKSSTRRRHETNGSSKTSTAQATAVVLDDIKFQIAQEAQQAATDFETTSIKSEDHESCSDASLPLEDVTLPAVSDSGERLQPETANAAMMRFQRRAEQIDNISLAATFGSGRRKTESDVGSMVNLPISSDSLPTTSSKPNGPADAPRKSSLFSLRVHRGSISSKLKRNFSAKDHDVQPSVNCDSTEQSTMRNVSPKSLTPKRETPKAGSPRLNTNIVSSTQEARSPNSMLQWIARPIRRSRSRSDIAKSPVTTSNLAGLWHHHGGPPIPNLGTSNLDLLTPTSVAPMVGGDESADEGDLPSEELRIRSDIALIPTTDGFRYYAFQLNPSIQPWLLAREVTSQSTRYQRLRTLREKHRLEASTGVCRNSNLCTAADIKALPLYASKAKHSTANGASMFRVHDPKGPSNPTQDTVDDSIAPAIFPPGIPLPPVSFLPAKFECPFCFTVKEFKKPSDWSKHVLEDLQPFSCTFENCEEPKSFKRKADWVRHEGEVHRQLEFWDCNMSPDCKHRVYRKDNFVQHLMREHGVPDPKARTGRAASTRAAAAKSAEVLDMTADEVWALVDRCHGESSRHAGTEPCRFCGKVFHIWRLLIDHLAQHQLQIALPILDAPELALSTTTLPRLDIAAPPHNATSSDMPTLTVSPIDDGSFFTFDGNLPQTTQTIHSDLRDQLLQPTSFSMPFTGLNLTPSSDYSNTSANSSMALPGGLGQPFFMPNSGRPRAVSFHGQSSESLMSNQGSMHPRSGGFMHAPLQSTTIPSHSQHYQQHIPSILTPWQQQQQQVLYQAQRQSQQ